MKASSQLKNQLAAVVIEMHFARTFNGKISPVTTLRPMLAVRLLSPMHEVSHHAPAYDVSRASMSIPCVDCLTWSKRAGKEEDVDADERELRRRRGLVAERSCGTACSDDVLADTHADGTRKEHEAAAESVNGVQSGKCRDDVDHVRYHLKDKGVRKAGRWAAGEVAGSVVELRK